MDVYKASRLYGELTVRGGRLALAFEILWQKNAFGAFVYTCKIFFECF